MLVNTLSNCYKATVLTWFWGGTVQKNLQNKAHSGDLSWPLCSATTNNAFALQIIKKTLEDRD